MNHKLMIIRKLGIIGSPAIFMGLVTLIVFSKILEGDLKGHYILSLLVLFPLSMLLQGVFCAMYRCNLVIALMVSLTAFLLIIWIYLNSSAYVYLIYYTLIFLVGYGGRRRSQS